MKDFILNAFATVMVFLAIVAVFTFTFGIGFVGLEEQPEASSSVIDMAYGDVRK